LERVENVFFNSENVDFELSDESKIINWLQVVAKREGNNIVALSFIFCDDEYLHEMNVEYLNHDTLTDVITFQYSETEVDVEGDIFISIDRIKENAATYNVTMQHELNRVMVHGTLHLLGYADKSPEEKALMTEKENEYLDLLGKM
jgi:probable rRNA maturation factor